MARFETHHFKAGDSRSVAVPVRPTEVFSWYGQGEPRPPYIIRHNVMTEDYGHDWTWKQGVMHYSGTHVVGECQGVDMPRDSVPKPFWVIFQYGEADPIICTCGKTMEPSFVFCPHCGAKR